MSSIMPSVITKLLNQINTPTYYFYLFFRMVQKIENECLLCTIPLCREQAKQFL